MGSWVGERWAQWMFQGQDMFLYKIHDPWPLHCSNSSRDVTLKMPHSCSYTHTHTQYTCMYPPVTPYSTNIATDIHKSPAWSRNSATHISTVVLQSAGEELRKGARVIRVRRPDHGSCTIMSVPALSMCCIYNHGINERREAFCVSVCIHLLHLDHMYEIFKV